MVSFGYLLHKNLIDHFKSGAINVHPSLLPKYRGASPIQYAIWNEEKVTGVSIIGLSTSKFDAGRIFNQKKVVNMIYESFYQERHSNLCKKK